MNSHQVAVIIPCYNEEVTIGQLVKDFKAELPKADIYVYDNNSTDDTAVRAKEAGAIVRKEARKGKGNVVKKMFYDIDADYYVMVDGDRTYLASEVHKLLQPVINGEADMVVGTRLGEYSDKAFRKFHKFGNGLITALINLFFKANLKDVLSGYRVFNRKFVDTIPVISKGFEVETELTINALDYSMELLEVPIKYLDRPDNNPSKLNTLKDGFLILFTIVTIFKDFRPLLFFFIISSGFAVLGLLVGTPVIIEFINTGLVYKVPSAILAAALELLSVQFIGLGLVLDTIARNRRSQYVIEIRRRNLNKFRD